MARNKHPEESRKKILAVAEELFLEKGYDSTSIQDIVDGLGGMTRGVIYHHFKSKFEILSTLMEESPENGVLFLFEGTNGMEKLQSSLRSSFKGIKKQALAYSAAVTIRSPRILGEQYLSSFKEVGPMIENVVREGIEDGTIQTDNPQEIAELMILTMNLWIGLQASVLTEEELQRKTLFIQKLFEGVGVPLLTDEIVQDAFNLFAYLKNE